MNRYEQILKENITRMGIQLSNFHSVEFEIIEGVPFSKIPSGYTTPDTMFKNTNSGNMCCELCGHVIKNAYYIVDDEHKLILMVGSECVTHFTGETGKNTEKNAKFEYLKECYNAYQELYSDLWEKTHQRYYDSYGRYCYRVHYFTKLGKIFVAIDDLIGKAKVNSDNLSSLTRWYNRYNQELCRLFNEAL